MSEVVVIAIAKARPGKEAEAEALVKGLLEPTHPEEGCILYAPHRTDDGTTFGFVERWASNEHLDKHLATPHLAAFGERADEVFSSIEVYRLAAMPGGDPTKGSLAGHAGAH